MERIAYFADLSVKRACAFAVFAIGMTMMGLMFDFFLAVRAGAFLFTIMLAILVLFSERRYPKGFRDTELWALLDGKHELPYPEDRARQILAGIMRDTYVRYAKITAAITASLWLIVAISWGRKVAMA